MQSGPLDSQQLFTWDILNSAVIFLDCLLVCSLLAVLLQSFLRSACWNQDSYSGSVAFTALIKDTVFVHDRKRLLVSPSLQGTFVQNTVGVPLFFSLLE